MSARRSLTMFLLIAVLPSAVGLRLSSPQVWTWPLWSAGSDLLSGFVLFLWSCTDSDARGYVRSAA
jgi:hypothetical protein